MHGVNPRSVQTVRVLATSDGDNTVVAAPGAGKRILVLGYQLRYLGAVGGEAVTIRSGAAGTIHYSEVAATTPGARPPSYVGDLESPAFLCDDNALLNINNAAGADTIGHITYVIRQTSN